MVDSVGTGGEPIQAAGHQVELPRNALKITLLLLVLAGAAGLVGWNISQHAEAPLNRIVRIIGGLAQAPFTKGNALYLLAVGCTLVIEAVALGYQNSSCRRLLRPSRSAVVDLFCWIALMTGLFGVLTYILSLGISSVISDRLAALVPRGALAFDNPVIQTFWLLIVSDFLKYVMHYLQHKIPVWWQTHKFHHSATEMNVITAARGHPSEGVLDIIFLAIPTALLDGTATQFLVLNFATTILGGLQHSMVEWRFGWLGRWILNSPVNHRIHHSAIPEHFDRNFASIFVFWDRIFGTCYRGPALNAMVDVKDNPYNRKGLLYDLYLGAKLPVVVAVSPLTGLARRLVRRATAA